MVSSKIFFCFLFFVFLLTPNPLFLSREPGDVFDNDAVLHKDGLAGQIEMRSLLRDVAHGRSASNLGARPVIQNLKKKRKSTKRTKDLKVQSKERERCSIAFRLTQFKGDRTESNTNNA